MNTGIYQIRNTVNDLRYIGSAVSLHTRLGTHKRELYNGKHTNAKLQRSWDKYGSENFVFEKLIICSKENLLMYEQRAIDAYCCVENGYNIAPIAGNTLGVRKTEDEKRRISIAHTGRKHSEESKANMAKAQLGRNHSEETKAKMSAIHKERILNLPEEKKSAWSFVGHHHSDEAKAKISAANKGRIYTDEARANFSAASKGRKQTDEDKKNKSIARKKWLSNPENKQIVIDAIKKGHATRAANRAAKLALTQQESLNV